MAELIDVDKTTTILNTIIVLAGEIVDYTLKPDVATDINRQITKLTPRAKSDLKLQVKYTNQNTSLIMIHKYTWRSGDLLCWIYVMSHRRIYSYLNGAFMGASKALDDFTIDDV